MIVITCPGFSLHGGIRIILEWANRLNAHESVTILTGKPDRPTWFKLDKSIDITTEERVIRQADKLIICSPHHIHLQDNPKRPEKSFIFMQMCEHLFNETNVKWVQQCMRFYRSLLPMMLISNWNFGWVKDFGRTAPTYYIGNGVNLGDFPINDKPKDGKTILLESPVASNNSKDVDHLALKVGFRLKQEGYKVLSYGALKLVHDYGCMSNGHYVKPSLEQLNTLYSTCSVMIKATKYDARSTAPMEAMTKGCVTARALVHGDDDLIHGVNCLRSDYEEEALYQNAKKLLTDHELRKELAKNCIDYVQKFSWEYYLPQILGILNDNPAPHTIRYL